MKIPTLCDAVRQNETDNRGNLNQIMSMKILEDLLVDAHDRKNLVR